MKVPDFSLLDDHIETSRKELSEREQNVEKAFRHGFISLKEKEELLADMREQWTSNNKSSCT